MAYDLQKCTLLEDLASAGSLGASRFCAKATADDLFLSCMCLLRWAYCFPQGLILHKFFSGKIHRGEGRKNSRKS